jgi:hypothetical protein
MGPHLTGFGLSYSLQIVTMQPYNWKTTSQPIAQQFEPFSGNSTENNMIQPINWKLSQR